MYLCPSYNFHWLKSYQSINHQHPYFHHCRSQLRPVITRQLQRHSIPLSTSDKSQMLLCVSEFLVQLERGLRKYLYCCAWCTVTDRSIKNRHKKWKNTGMYYHCQRQSSSFPYSRLDEEACTWCGWSVRGGFQSCRVSSCVSDWSQ